MREPVLIQGHATVDIRPEEAFRLLLEPAEQLKWNTLYLQAETHPAGPIRNGTVMTGRFKGSGRAKVVFERLIPGREFTHYSRMKLFGFLYLGEFRHTYRVEPAGAGSEITQTVAFEPRAFGLLLKRTIVAGFRARLPESFAEFEAYARKARGPGSRGEATLTDGAG